MKTNPSAAAATQLGDWVGRSEARSDQVAAAPLMALSAILDRDEPMPRIGAVVPPLAHWLYFLPVVRHSQIGHDGHAARGDFLPPVPLARRMWVGGRVNFHGPLRVGDAIERFSQVINVSEKTGHSGPLVFVTVRHEVRSAGRTALIEEQDLVYLPVGGQARRPAPSCSLRGNPEWTCKIQPDPVLLFRFSALTFNAHRIHYDRTYAREVEGLPALLVQAPLTALLLLESLRKHLQSPEISEFSFRAMKPLLDTSPFVLCGRSDADQRGVALWVADAAGDVAMEAAGTLA